MYKKSALIVISLIIFYICSGIGLSGLISLIMIFTLKLIKDINIIIFLIGSLIFIIYVYYNFVRLFNSIEINGDIVIIKRLFRKKIQFSIQKNIFLPSIKTYSIDTIPFAEVLILKIINKENKKTFKCFLAGYDQEVTLEFLENII